MTSLLLSLLLLLCPVLLAYNPQHRHFFPGLPLYAQPQPQRVNDVSIAQGQQRILSTLLYLDEDRLELEDILDDTSLNLTRRRFEEMKCIFSSMNASTIKQYARRLRS